MKVLCQVELWSNEILVEKPCQQGGSAAAARNRSLDDINLHHGEEALSPPLKRHSWPHLGSSES